MKNFYKRSKPGTVFPSIFCSPSILVKEKNPILLPSFFRRTEKVRSLYCEGGYQSGQLGQTVNLLTYVFVGSNPAPPTAPVIVLVTADINWPRVDDFR